MSDLLSVKDLEVRFETRESVVYAVNGVSFNVRSGETLGIVGESGSGKTVGTMSLLRLIPTPPGRIVAGIAEYKGKDLLTLPDEELRRIRGCDIGVIFQDPMTAFNPVMTIGDQLIEARVEHGNVTKKEALEEAEEFLRIVGIPAPCQRLKDFPHQFSGGMRQRAMIAMGLIRKPNLLIADEPTTALDVTVQAQILDLVGELKADFGTSMIWISHDLGVVAGIADRVIVMYAGMIVEEAPVDDLYSNPQHPYTRGLLDSLPSIDSGVKQRLPSIGGLPPFMSSIPEGCPFAPRCSYKMERCDVENPKLEPRESQEHKAACWARLEERMRSRGL